MHVLGLHRITQHSNMDKRHLPVQALNCKSISSRYGHTCTYSIFVTDSITGAGAACSAGRVVGARVACIAQGRCGAIDVALVGVGAAGAEEVVGADT